MNKFRFSSGFYRIAAITSLMLLSGASQAHFQLLYTQDTAPSRGSATNFLMLFTHPVHGGPHMDMGKPENFYVVSQRGGDAEAVTTDLSGYLEQVQWTSTQGATAAYRASLPRSVTRSLGDYVFVLEPSPYYEAEEDKYIQQFTRTMVNVAGVPGNWSAPMNLAAEILPLNKPYANWVGGVFRGRVLADGEPVPNAEIEVEYINHDINWESLSFAEQANIDLPQGSFGTMTIYADSQGEFTIGLPKAGWWGICALDIGADKEHDGKPLSQDAVLWVQARDISP